uniref:Checkpoint protein n=1 Tax=Ciona intestinalis TaxID=7719 RepID=F7BFF4_CIOIN|nr:checkpoint protein HUS1-like isoform X2 [Ciona intestinalis]|eukprot:XP_002130439.1 checkpoint protein HUS1-like isoform X2 [Ciona intestinalis]
MRFRAKVVNIDCIHHFTNVVNTISKLLKKCSIRLTKEKMFFILPDQVANGGVSMWCELKQANFFDEYRMDGVNEYELNEIYLEIVAENLCRAIKSANNAKSLKIKLTKKQVPCLTVEIELPSLSSTARIVTHDIPVSVIPSSLWGEYQEPEMPDFHVSLCLPPLKTVKHIVERLKNLSSYLTLSGNQEGDFALKVETELVSATTRFSDLEIPPYDPDGDSQAPSKLWPPSEMASARIDVKKLLQFLAGQQINPYKVICNIVDQSAVHFFLVHDDISLQYFIPVVAV